MITSPFDRNSAERFDDLLEGRTTHASAEFTDLLAFAERVWAVPAPSPRPDFAASLRERLMAEAPSALAHGATDNRLSVKTPAHGSKGRQRRVTAAVAVFSIAGAATGTAFASESALPGDTLYPVKRLVESVHAAVSLGDKAKGSVELDQATTRLGEATKLAKAGNASDAADALSDFVTQATQGSDLLTSAAQGSDIHAFTTSSLVDLTDLAHLLPADVLSPVLQTLLSIDKAVTAAFPDAGDGINELPTPLLRLLSADVPAGRSGAVAGKPGKRGTNGASSAPSGTTDPGTPPPAVASKSPQAKPTGSALGDTVGGVVGGVGDTLGQVGDGLGGPLGGVVGGLGDTVGGLGNAVGGLLGGSTTAP